jgi:hypothetical protein
MTWKGNTIHGLYPSRAWGLILMGISGREFNQWTNDACVNGRKLPLLLSPALPLNRSNPFPFLNHLNEPRAHHSPGNHTCLSIRPFSTFATKLVCALIFLRCLLAERWCSLLRLSDIPNPKLEEMVKDTHACTLATYRKFRTKGSFYAVFMSHLPRVTELNLVRDVCFWVTILRTSGFNDSRTRNIAELQSLLRFYISCLKGFFLNC